MAIIVTIDQCIGTVFTKIKNKALETKTYAEGIKTNFTAEKVYADILIIGSSTASHHYISNMIADSLGLSVYNCGMDGCFFYYQNCMIDLVLKRYSPKIILWEIGFDALSKNYDHNREYQSVNGLYPYYYNNYCKNFIDKEDDNQKYKMLLYSYRYNGVIPNYISVFQSGSNMNNGYEPISCNVYRNPSLKFKNCKSNLDYDKTKTLNCTLQKCKKQGVKVIITASPQFVIDSIYKNSKQYKALHSIANNNNMSIIDFYNDSRFLQDSTIFKDSQHMNDRGTKIYMGVFIPVLKSVLHK